MITLKIENPEIEKIFLDGFNSNKELFYEFIKENYNKKIILNSLDKSIKQAQLQENGEIKESTLGDLINELESNTHT